MSTGTAVLILGGVAAAAGVGYLIWQRRSQENATALALRAQASSVAADLWNRSAAAQTVNGGGIMGNINSVVNGASGLVGDLNGIGQRFGLPSLSSLTGGLL